MSKNNIVEKIVNDLIEKQGNNLLSIYGIGSYFDPNLPSDWIKNDIDIIVIVKSLNLIPKQDWTEVRFEKKNINEINIWIGFNTMEGLQMKGKFEAESFANYEWSLIDLKLPENSKLIYGEDIRARLPRIINIQFDYNDVFLRSLYHLDKSLKETHITSKSLKASTEFTKAIFKFGYYLCVFHDKNFYLTSIQKSANKLEELLTSKKIDKIMLDFFYMAIKFRRKSHFDDAFKTIRTNFIVYIVSLLVKGKLHRKMSYDEFKKYISSKFNGLPYLVKFLNKVKKKYFQSKLKINE